MSDTDKAVVSTAHELSETSREKVTTLSTGVRARLTPVSGALISDVVSKIKDPIVPTFHNADKDREEPNPSDPSYIAALAEAERQRGQASIDAVIMFGIELVDSLPENDQWLLNLKRLEKKGLLDLSEYDLEDLIDVEYLYKKYIAVGNADFTLLAKLSGVTQEDIAKAEAGF